MYVINAVDVLNEIKRMPYLAFSLSFLGIANLQRMKLAITLNIIVNDEMYPNIFAISISSLYSKRILIEEILLGIFNNMVATIIAELIIIILRATCIPLNLVNHTMAKYTENAIGTKFSHIIVKNKFQSIDKKSELKISTLPKVYLTKLIP